MAGADWLLVGPNNIGTLDIRATMQTRDGALIYAAYKGRVDLAADRPVVYAAPLYETGDERYQWLNKLQCAAKGVLDNQVLEYEIYELR